MIDNVALSPEDLKATIRLFQELIRIDTTNPPGAEGKAAEYLKAVFDGEGIACDVVGMPTRENVVARLQGQKEKPRLLFLSHTDVVPAFDVGAWTHPPFSGEIEDGWVYGRGACDDKFDVAVQTMSLILLKRRNLGLNGTLLFASVADEEVGGRGAEWATKRTPDRVAAEYVIGEGGGPPIQIGKGKFYPITVGEKGLAWFKLNAIGRGGHGSVPSLGDNANLIMARAFINLSNCKTKIRIIDEVAQSISALLIGFLGKEEGSTVIDRFLNEQGLDKVIEMIASKDEEAAEELRAVTRMTISPNVISGGTETNVIPGMCVGRIDTRLVPGQNLDYASQVVKDCISGLSIEAEVEQYSDASLSTWTTNFYDTIQTSIKELAPDCSTIPQLSTGSSDSGYWRALGSVVYGFVPMSPNTKVSDTRPGIHGPNERANIESLEFATRFLCKVAAKVLR